jgi:Cdc6-like AAA superfamily ATPase
MKKNKEIIIIVDLNNNLLDQNEDEIIYQIDYFNIYKKLSYLVILFFYSIK